MSCTAKSAPDFLKKSVIYQIFLRPFTPGGTLQSAFRMLPYLSELGADILYLCPPMVADDDVRLEFWSDRQKKCALNNPMNPYRLKDYYNVDPEYGTNEDLKKFVAGAHELGMRVILDLVYYHCGPTPVFLKEHPDFVVRDAEGRVKNGRWHFPELNFESSALREYLWQNMEMFIRNYDFDGFRCDVADAVPLDFWEEGRRRIEAIKPDVIMLAESGQKNEQNTAFDLNYFFAWGGLSDVFRGDEPASKIVEIWQEYMNTLLPGARVIHATENHDIVNESGENRIEKIIGRKGHDAMLFLDFSLDGVPFLYNGQEIADSSMHSIWGNRFHGRNLTIDWSNALTTDGQARFDLVRKLISMRKTEEALYEGSVNWLEHDHKDSVLALTRNSENQNLLIAVNCRNQPVRVTLNCRIARVVETPVIMNRGADFRIGDDMVQVDLLPYGFLMMEY